MDGRLLGNNNRNNRRESLLGEISEAIMGLKEEMEENRNNTRQINEKQTQMERKIEEEEEKNKGSEAIERRIDSVKPQEDRQHGGIRYEQTRAPQSSSIGVKSEVKVAPPGLNYAGWGGRVFGQIPKKINTHTKLPDRETDSVMAEKHTTQGQTSGSANTIRQRGNGNGQESIASTS